MELTIYGHTLGVFKLQLIERNSKETKRTTHKSKFVVFFFNLGHGVSGCMFRHFILCWRHIYVLMTSQVKIPIESQIQKTTNFLQCVIRYFSFNFHLLSWTGNLPKVLPYKVIKQLNSSFTGKLHSDHRTPLCAFSDDFINSKFWQPNLETIGGVTMSLKTVKLAPKKWRISQATILPSFMRFGKFFTSLRTMWEKKTPISGHRVVLITFFFFFFFPFFFFLLPLQSPLAAVQLVWPFQVLEYFPILFYFIYR